MPCISTFGSVQRQSLSVVAAHDSCSTIWREQFCYECLLTQVDLNAPSSQLTAHDGNWSSKSCACTASVNTNESDNAKRTLMIAADAKVVVLSSKN